MNAPQPKPIRCQCSEQGINRLAREFTALFKVKVTSKDLHRWLAWKLAEEAKANKCACANP